MVKRWTYSKFNAKTHMSPELFPSVHPSADTSSAEEIAEHFAECPACQKQAARWGAGASRHDPEVDAWVQERLDEQGIGSRFKHLYEGREDDTGELFDK